MAITTSKFRPGLFGVANLPKKFSDAEFEQSVIRLLLGSAIAIYFLIFESFQLWWVVTYLSFVFISVLLATNVYFQPGNYCWRRITGQFVDLGTTTILLFAGGEMAVAIFGVYLWVILGNGFRFGLRYLLSAIVISTVFFLLVVFNEPFWREHKTLTLGFGTTLLVVPVYFAILLQRLNKAKTHLERISEHDELTGLLNRRAFDAKIASEFCRLKRSCAPFTLALLDIDHFKAVNDTYGHLAGDAVLENIAHIIEESCRDIDIVARFGGEEFALLLPGHKKDGTTSCGERIRQEVEKTTTIVDSESIRVTISIGMAYWCEQYDSVENWIQDADSALYEAKRRGRNKVFINQPVEDFASTLTN